MRVQHRPAPDLPRERTGFVAWARRRLIQSLAAVGGYREAPRPIVLSTAPRILLIRLDPRLGNRLLLLPLMRTLKKRFASAEIDFLGHSRSASFFANHPDLNRYIAFDKRRAFGREGWLFCLRALGRRRYDVCIDAGNPTDPSATQALVTRLIGARYSVGASHRYYRDFYTHPVTCAPAGPHEVDMRLSLLGPLPGTLIEKEARLPAPSRPISVALDRLMTNKPRVDCLLFVGARLAAKQLSQESYLDVARLIEAAGCRPVIVGGLGDHQVADEIFKALPTVVCAPELDVAELAWLMAHVRAVLSCDTGPMHLAVAVGTPTCALFVSTDPARYGPRGRQHRSVDARARDRSLWLPEVRAFLAVTVGA